MTTNKLPDVVWLSPSVMRSDGWHMSYIANVLGNSHCYVQKSALDAMTAERDALRHQLEKDQRMVRDLLTERDSARDMLRAIRDSTYRDAVTLRGMADNFLAAQPETKP